MPSNGGNEFLPLCDVLFNVISIAAYFVDLLFDLLVAYALFARNNDLFLVVLCLVLSSLVVSQIVSLKWFLSGSPSGQDAIEGAQSNADPEVVPKLQSVCVKETRKGRYVVFLFHTFQLGILWRYAKLFIPVNLRHVKHEVRDLCMLRLLHAFCESAPMLLLQLHVLASMQIDEAANGGAELRLKLGGPIAPSGPHSYPTSAILLQQNRTFKDLNTISGILSLFSVCWALASFSKNVRLQNVHRLVLTWLGVIFQFFWRLGTVISRVTALTVYGSLYHQWIFLVIILHWVSMLLWLISPKNVFHGEKISRLKKAALSAMIAFVYVFAYINLQEHNPRQKMTIFYIVMFLENLLLVGLWLVGIWPDRPEQWMMAPVTVVASFAIGILFMVTYYRYFHVRRLGFESGGRPELEEYQSKNKSSCSSKFIGGDKSGAKYNAAVVPGVFNCRFTNPVNGATKRKKKKPTSFVPPPNLKIPTGQNGPHPNPLLPQVQQNAQPQHLTALQNQIQIQNCESPQSLTQYEVTGGGGGPMQIPFWKRPLVPPSNGSSENESSIGSRVNIQQKLHQKKQKQLAELKVIEEEIKAGKLVGPHVTGTLSSNEDTRQQSLPRQPIPRIKKHIDLDPAKYWASDDNGGYSNMMVLQNCYPDTSDVDMYGTAYVVEHPNTSQLFNQTNNLNMPNDSLTRAVIAKSKVPRTFHQNIQAPSPTRIGTDTNTSSSNQSQSRAPFKNVARHLPSGVGLMNGGSPNVHEGQFAGYNNSNGSNMMVVPSQKSNRGTPTIQNAQINSPMMMILHQQQQQQQQQQQHRMTPSEVLLSPHPYLEQNGMHPPGELYDWNREGSSEDEEDNTVHHPPSDIDSQMSLPRSYTLPREFKYYNKRSKSRKMDNFVTSNNNSSDGDVDSVDEENDSNLNNSGHTTNKHYYHHNMTRRQYAQQQQQHGQLRNPPMATGRISVPTAGANQHIYLNSPPYVRNLDLISNVLDGTVVGQHLASPARRMRYPGFRGGGTAMNEVRHETKL